MVEYGLLIALIALVVAVSATTLGQSISNVFNEAAKLATHCEKVINNTSGTPAAGTAGGSTCNG